MAKSKEEYNSQYLILNVLKNVFNWLWYFYSSLRPIIFVEKENHLPQIELKNKVQDDDGNHIYEAPPDLIGNTPNSTSDLSEQRRYQTIHKVNVPLPKLPSQNEDNEGKSDKLDYVAVIEPHYQP